MPLSKDQDAALDEILAFLSEPGAGEMALSGPGGTGKTHLTKEILREAKGGKRKTMWDLLLGTGSTELTVHLTSSTNKAANVLADATGAETQTIHKLLKLTVKNDYSTGLSKVIKTKNTPIISNALVIIDEASMINKQLLQMIRECTMNCKVLYIGDAYQLAPVRENTSPVFTDAIPQVKLTTIHRQAQGNPIIQFAGEFRDSLDTSVFPTIGARGSNIYHLDDADFKAEIVNQFNDNTEVIPSRILSWSNKRVHQYNAFVRELHDPDIDYKRGEYLITNAAVMDGEGARIFRGDQIVKITDIHEDTKDNIDGWTIVIDNKYTGFQARDMLHVTQLLKHYAKHKDWKNYFEAKDAFLDLRPYYASTINKAQGSTYRNVFIDVGDIGKNTKNPEISRLMYTAITRASNNVYLRGDLPPRLYNV